MGGETFLQYLKDRKEGILVSGKMLPFRHCPKVALTPLSISDICVVTFGQCPKERRFLVWLPFVDNLFNDLNIWC